MERNFEISLVDSNSKKLLTSYKWYLIPNIGDKLSLSNSDIFLIEERLLPTDESNRVVLIGKIIE